VKKLKDWFPNEFINEKKERIQKLPLSERQVENGEQVDYSLKFQLINVLYDNILSAGIQFIPIIDKTTVL
jgi:hypothetical protein